jgi:hypothetical protein
LIVRFAGLKAKFLIVIIVNPPDGTEVAGVVACGIREEVQPEKKQVRMSKIAHADPNKTRECDVIVSLNAARNKKYFLSDSIKRGVQGEVSSYLQQHPYSTK